MVHKHEWVLIDKSNGNREYKPLPEGQWIGGRGLFGRPRYMPGFDSQDLRERLVDIVTEQNLPTISSQTWTCNCGETKTNYQQHPGVYELLKGSSD